MSVTWQTKSNNIYFEGEKGKEVIKRINSFLKQGEADSVEDKVTDAEQIALKSLEPCVCACKCSGSGGITVATLVGLKLDVAILESRLNVANSYDGVVSELDSIRSKQRDVEAVIRKQDEMICKLY